MGLLNGVILNYVSFQIMLVLSYDVFKLILVVLQSAIRI